MVRCPIPTRRRSIWRRRLSGGFENGWHPPVSPKFCRQENCSVASFYQTATQARTNQQKNRRAFVAVGTGTHSDCGSVNRMIQIELPGGAIVRLDTDFPQHLFAKIDSRNRPAPPLGEHSWIAVAARNRILRLHAAHRHAEKSFNGLSGIVDASTFEADSVLRHFRFSLFFNRKRDLCQDSF